MDEKTAKLYELVVTHSWFHLEVVDVPGDADAGWLVVREEGEKRF